MLTHEVEINGDTVFDIDRIDWNCPVVEVTCD